MTDTEYYDLIRPYDDAMKLLLTRLEILNHNIYKASAENPIHTMQYRIKSKQSIEEKLIRKGEEPTLENAKDLLQDIAGIRIVCYFVGDIKNLIDMLKKQSDLITKTFEIRSFFTKMAAFSCFCGPHRHKHVCKHPFCVHLSL